MFRREVLLSYRLLFGQDKKSRRRFREVERRRVAPSKQQYDPLLDILCSKSLKECNQLLPAILWPDSCLDVNGLLLEPDVYSSTLDFAVMADHLLRIQAFDARQQPRRVWDLWRDRRNPLQWYALWAVLVVGGITVLLTFLQLIVTTVQLGMPNKIVFTACDSIQENLWPQHDQDQPSHRPVLCGLRVAER